MLAIVEDQQQAPRSEGSLQRLCKGAIAALADADDACDRRRDEVRIFERPKFDEPNAVIEMPFDSASGLESEAAFPDSPGAGYRDEVAALSKNKLAQVRDLVFSVDEGGRRYGKVVRPFEGGCRRARRRRLCDPRARTVRGRLEDRALLLREAERRDEEGDCLWTRCLAQAALDDAHRGRAQARAFRQMLL